MVAVMSWAMAIELRTQRTNPTTQLLTTIRAFTGWKASEADDLNCARTTRLKNSLPFIIHLTVKKSCEPHCTLKHSVGVSGCRRCVTRSPFAPVEPVPGFTNLAGVTRSFALKKKIAKTPSLELSRLGLVYLS